MDQNITPEEEQQLTKAQKYEQRRLEKEAVHAKRATSQTIKRVLRWLGLVVIIIAGIYGLTKLPQGTVLPSSSSTLSDPITATDNMRGKADSTITFVEYADFQCPACGSSFPLLDQLFGEYKDRVRFVIRNFPLKQHQFALVAAQAAEAAGKQGKYWEMHDLLFKNQASWSVEADPTGTFTKYAQDLSLNVDQWRSDMQSKTVTDKISFDYASGVRSGVDSTPTFFLNDQKMAQPNTYADFKKALDDALAKPTPSPSA